MVILRKHAEPEIVLCKKLRRTTGLLQVEQLHITNNYCITATPWLDGRAGTSIYIVAQFLPQLTTFLVFGWQNVSRQKNSSLIDDVFMP